MRPCAATAEVVGKVLIGVVMTAILSFLVFPYAAYGTLGVYAAFTEHQAWTLAAMIYRALLIVPITCGVAAVLTWMLLFAGVRRPRP